MIRDVLSAMASSRSAPSRRRVTRSNSSSSMIGRASDLYSPSMSTGLSTSPAPNLLSYGPVAQISTHIARTAASMVPQRQSHFVPLSSTDEPSTGESSRRSSTNSPPASRGAGIIPNNPARATSGRTSDPESEHLPLFPLPLRPYWFQVVLLKHIGKSLI